MHHRPVPRVEAYVWWCGDEYCGCTQPRIDRVEPNGLGVTRVNLWAGTFRDDHDDGGKTELNHLAKQMRRLAQEMYHDIWWPWSDDRWPTFAPVHSQHPPGPAKFTLPQNR